MRVRVGGFACECVKGLVVVNDFMMDWKGGGSHICAVNKNDLEKQKSVFISSAYFGDIEDI